MARAKTELAWDEVPDKSELKEVARTAENASGDVREVQVAPAEGLVKVLVTRDTDPLQFTLVDERVIKLGHERHKQTVQTGFYNGQAQYGEEVIYEVYYEVAAEVEVEKPEKQPGNVKCDASGNDAIKVPGEMANDDATDEQVRDAVNEAEEWGDSDPNAHLL